MGFSDAVTERINAIEQFANHAPLRYLPLKAGAWIMVVLAVLLTNFIAIARWPIAWLVGLVAPKASRESAPQRIDSPSCLDTILEEYDYVLVDFWAQWCGPCMLMNPAVDEVSERYSQKLRVAKVDASTQGEICKRYKVRGLPTLILFMKGVEIERKSGAMTASDLSSWVEATTQVS